MSFRIGDKVVCVDDSVQPWDHEFHHPNGIPTKGEVYCIEEYFPPFSVVEGRMIGSRFGGAVRISGKPVIHTETGTLWIHMACCFRLVSEVGHPPVQLSHDCTVDSGGRVG